MRFAASNPASRPAPSRVVLPGIEISIEEASVVRLVAVDGPDDVDHLGLVAGARPPAGARSWAGLPRPVPAGRVGVPRGSGEGAQDQGEAGDDGRRRAS